MLPIPEEIICSYEFGVVVGQKHGVAFHRELIVLTVDWTELLTAHIYRGKRYLSYCGPSLNSRYNRFFVNVSYQ